jgi:hypothetical protein
MRPDHLGARKTLRVIEAATAYLVKDHFVEHRELRPQHPPRRQQRSDNPL